MLNHPYILEIKVPVDHGEWSFLCVLLNSVCQYSMKNFCNYIHQGYWPIVLFPGSSLFWLWYYSNASLIKPIWEHSFLFFFFFFNKSFDNDLVLSVFCKILQWSSLVLVFLVLGIFDYPFSLLINKWSVQIFYFFWVSLAGYMFFFFFHFSSGPGYASAFWEWE